MNRGLVLLAALFAAAPINGSEITRANACFEIPLAKIHSFTIGALSPSTSVQTLQLKLRDGGEKFCSLDDNNLKRIVASGLSTISGNEKITLADVIELVFSPWPPLANGAVAHIEWSFSKGEQLTASQLMRLVRGTVENQINPSTAKRLIRVLAQGPKSHGIGAVGDILRQSSKLEFQRAAARWLGRSDSPMALTALQECAARNDRLLSARCTRSILRWKAQNKGFEGNIKP